MNFRPRGVLSRAIYEKIHNDSILNDYDSRLWYRLNQELPPVFQSKFVPLLQPDETTVRWLENAQILSCKIWLHVWHAVARTILQFFLTQTDINGLLKRGSMYILSEKQFELLLHRGGLNITPYETVSLLDIGAGDGEISLRLINSLKGIRNSNVQVYVTEASSTMRKRLKKHKFEVIDRIKSLNNVQLISCLNVLDRCIDPIELLQDIHIALAPNGRAIVALVLPYVHYVELNSTHLPDRPLLKHWPTKQLSFEQEAVIFFELIDKLGFRVEAWTKAPYLCEGDLRQSFYWLIDLVVVLSKKPEKN